MATKEMHSEKGEMKADKKHDVALINKAFNQQDKPAHKGGKGTALKLKAGGVTSKEMMQMGRNMARVANQRKG